MNIHVYLSVFAQNGQFLNDVHHILLSLRHEAMIWVDTLKGYTSVSSRF